jgi:hypothetical protein
MAYASYPDQPHPGLPIPMYLTLFAIALSVVLPLILADWPY